MTQPPARYRIDELNRFATDLFSAAGMPADRAAIVAKYLVEADAMGHDTHGLAQAVQYLDDLHTGDMTARGEIEVVSDRGATVTWDGNYLSGVWLTWRAIQTACERAAEFGTVTVVIRRSHHIACLAAYLTLATDRNFLITLASSDPSVKAVAPHGSYQAVYTPNPLAMGIPTTGDPILIDISASATTMALAARSESDTGRLPGAWLVDNQGQASDDPAVLKADPPGALAPLGGPDRGHKGFALGLMIEAMTSGLGGFGRPDGPPHWGAAVYLQVIDPDAFGGVDQFTRQTGWLADACRAAAVPNGANSVRLPGDGALARKAKANKNGIALYPTILPNLAPWSDRLNVAPPAQIN